MHNIQDIAWLMKARELFNAQQRRKDIEKLESELATELRAMQEGKPKSFGGMKYSYDTRIGSVDYSAIPELKSVDLSKYRKPSVTVWKLAVEIV